MARRAHRIGRYSRGNVLARIDLRTREGRFLQAVQAELTEHVGGQPNAAQQLLIRLASIKALRVALMADYVLSEQAITERDDRQFLAWANSLRRDLDTLGITRRAKTSPRLAEILQGADDARGSARLATGMRIRVPPIDETFDDVGPALARTVPAA